MEKGNEKGNENKMNISVCSICHMPFFGMGHNAQPINDGRCCNDCNSVAVIPVRLLAIARQPTNQLDPSDFETCWVWDEESKEWKKDVTA
tara:strand:+ start:12381 stop:12650 length:270 start_codon:yes stop_codon:yes gene_type:complete